MNVDLENQVRDASALCTKVLNTFNEHIIGQKHLAERLLMALLSGEHVLLEGLPGLGKTTAVRTLASLTHLKFARIQFTPDLLPADILGTQMFDPRAQEFKVHLGPVFTHFLLADEINRAPAKVQSALLEVMQERQVTIGGETFPLEAPFVVLATQNPIEQQGTYPLPEAQVDRFMFKVKVGYTNAAEEKEMLKRHFAEKPQAPVAVLSKEELTAVMRTLARLQVADLLRDYITSLVQATRHPEKFHVPVPAGAIQFGASPRAAIFLEKGARAVALLKGRTYVTPQDVKDVAADVLQHRIILSYGALVDGIAVERIISDILNAVPVP